MTTREAFAAAALQGIIGNPTWNAAALASEGIPPGREYFSAAVMAVCYADALLDALKESPEPPAREVEGSY